MTELILAARGKIEKAEGAETRSDSEQLHRLLFDYAPDAYYLSDLQGYFVDGNKAAEEVTRYKREELIGKTFLNLHLLPASQIPKAAALLARNALGKSTGPDEFTLNRKDHTQVVVEIRTHPLRMEGRVLVLGIARDISERKKTEKAFEESRRKFESLFFGNPEAAVYLDKSLHIVEENPRFIDLFGHSLGETRGKQIDDIVVPNTLTWEAERLNREMAKGYVYHDTVRKRKDGSLVDVSISAAPTKVEGELMGYIAIYKDISRLKQTENSLRLTTEKLRTINEKLNVVSKMARHDVRNKISVVMSNAYLAKRELRDNIDVENRLKTIELACNKIDKILSFARAYELLGVEDLAYIDSERMFAEAAMLFSGLGIVKIQNRLQGLTVLADSLLRQLFYNLIDNSLRHGKKVTNIKAHYEAAGNGALKIIYGDNGVGIEDTDRKNLFREGYGKGTGYGLYLIERICLVYGWTIEETGKSGDGAQFTMTIPKMTKEGKGGYIVG